MEENVENFGKMELVCFNNVHPFPRTIDLGIFAAGETNEILFSFDKIEEEYQVFNSMLGLKVAP